MGGIEKELNLNETKVGMGLNLKDERSWNPKEVLYEIQFFSITDDGFLLVADHTLLVISGGRRPGTGEGRGVHTGGVTWSLSR